MLKILQIKKVTDPKCITPLYLKGSKALVSKAVFSFSQYAREPGKRRWCRNKQTAVNVEDWRWYYSCIFQVVAGWGAKRTPCLSKPVENPRLCALPEFLWSLGMSAQTVSSLHWKLLNNVSLLSAPSDGRRFYNHVYISLNPHSHFNTVELLL